MRFIKNKLFFISTIIVSIIVLNACRGEYPELQDPEITPLPKGAKGFFLLNESNMGNNKASLDHFDMESALYFQNIYPKLNPKASMYLGNVGNDLKIYGNKLYAVINASNYMEVMNLETGVHESSVGIRNCRYVVFHKGFAYVSSYNGPISIEPNAPLGTVIKVDTTSMAIVGQTTVGYQPEEMVVRDNKLYVANSGGYRVPDYDRTISVINLDNFKEEKKIDVGINLHRMQLDSDGNIYVSSRGDYKSIRSKMYIINRKDEVVRSLNIACSNMKVSGDSIYLYSTEWSHITQTNTTTYGIINTKTQHLVNSKFITDGTEKYITLPYGLAIDPETKDIFVTDAKDFVTSGTLYCFSKDGKLKWQVETGEIPAHIAFTDKKLKTIDILLPDKK